MKSLVDYILEASDNKSFTFNFKGLENVKETLESLGKFDYVTVNADDEKASVLVNKDGSNKFDSFIDVMQQYIDGLQKSTKIASDEQYAQKVKDFANKFNDFVSYIDELSAPKDDVDKASEENKDNKEEE